MRYGWGAMMSDKKQLLGMLTEMFGRWEKLLGSLSEAQITDRRFPGNWSVKDVMVHLWAWQQRTVARQEAALQDGEPDYLSWGGTEEPDPDENTTEANAWIYRTYKDKPWAEVYADWRGQFLRLLKLVEQTPEQDMLEPSRYAWMGESPLADSLVGTFEHHEEHYDMLLAWRSGNSRVNPEAG
jgi:hypothetical protein